MEITREEFYRAVDGLKADLKEDMVSIQNRLDLINGRVGRSEVTIENHRTRIVSLEKDVFKRRRGDTEGQGESWASGAVTKRERRLIAFGLVVLGITMKALELVGTKLWDVLTVHKP